MTKKGETFIYSSIFCVKYNFFLRRAEEKIKRENKKEKGSEFPECYRQNIYRTI